MPTEEEKFKADILSGLWSFNEVFTFREGDAWIAAWRSYNIVAQGSSERIALQRLCMSIAAHVLWDTHDGRAPLSNCPKPSDELIVKWAIEHAASHPRSE